MKLTLTNKLTFTQHIDHIKSKVNVKLGTLRRIRSTINKPTALMFYKTLILPHFDYGDILYDSLKQNDSRSLQVLQNRGLRIILRKDIYELVDMMHTALNMDQLDIRRKKHTLHMIYKILHNQAPPT